MKSIAAVSFLVFGLLACAGVGEKTDSTKIINVVDIHAIDTNPPAPPPPAALVTLMDSLPPGGVCSVRRYAARADQAREVFYEFGNRSYVIEVGKPPRRFLPVSIDIRKSEFLGDRTETENVFVGFNDNGTVSIGTRRFSVTGSQTVNDRGPLKTADSAAALQFVQQILLLCDGGR